MASSDNLDCVEQWLFSPAFPAPEPWFSDPFSFDDDTLFPKEVANSFSLSDNAVSELLNAATNTWSASASPSPSPSPGPSLDTPRGGQSITISGSGSGFGSDAETVSRRKQSVPGPVSGSVGKRKSRASKKSQTMFITADAANFRQMVQQVTGVKLSSYGQFSSMAQVLKPGPQRVGAASAAPIHGCLPTLDTSSFLLDHHHQQAVGHGGDVAARSGIGTASAPSEVGDNGGDVGTVGGRIGLDFDTLACFPTLESWKVT